ncbi:ricin-type beta-trefoil lectin domain protein [Streptomyces sp. AK02-01A]|uniref:ricin-type beta-trefoil lectin domain protein n=1 Tax=Streptomyces sp. AK02-01A TaxID=3028648 RepID=UPI0029AD361C|nr:ricin-type beta-trefoil lectin domain protein [Streptomyces sp. AK02-01A]MDX3849477.1 ricin-type beta-trefoil lectin domain protein [Streptomyces sp. AK02-01A]
MPPSGAASPEPESSDGSGAGRLSPGVLAGAALAGLLLVATPFALAAIAGGPSADRHTAAAKPGDTDVALDDPGPGFVPVPAASSGAPRGHAPVIAGAALGGPAASGGVGLAGPRPALSTTPASSADARDGAKPAAQTGTKSGTKSGAGTDTQTRSDSGRTGSTDTPKPPPAARQPAKAEVVSKMNNKCLDVTDYNYAPGNPVQMWTCRQQSNQFWQFYSDGTLRAGGLCMTSESGSGANGSPIRLEKCADRPQQQWVLNKREDIVNPAADKCLDVVDINRSSGARLQLWSCNGQVQQKWYKR